MAAIVRRIDYYLPEHELSNADLAERYPDWSVAKIESKTGIETRHIAGPDECSSDLACEAAKKVFASGACQPEDVDFVLLCTQSPDYFLPTSACLIQERLGIPTSTGALDFNLGCSGYVYGLSLAMGLVETRQAARVLLLTAETYSKFIHPEDKSVRTLFGDAGAATLVEYSNDNDELEPAAFVFGTDGRGGRNLIVPAGGLRRPQDTSTAVARCDDNGNWRSDNNLFMDGPEIFNFTLTEIPACVQRLLELTGRQATDIDRFVFHQANRYMLEHLRKKLRIPPERFSLCMGHCGNTVSSTIPIALRHAIDDGQLQPGSLIMLVGFGVGYSWSATVLEWPYLGLRRRPRSA